MIHVTKRVKVAVLQAAVVAGTPGAIAATGIVPLESASEGILFVGLILGGGILGGLVFLLAVRGRRAEFARTVQESQRTICRGCGIGSLGFVIVAGCESNVFDTVGIVISAVAFGVVYWCFLKAVPD